MLHERKVGINVRKDNRLIPTISVYRNKTNVQLQSQKRTVTVSPTSLGGFSSVSNLSSQQQLIALRRTFARDTPFQVLTLVTWP